MARLAWTSLALLVATAIAPPLPAADGKSGERGVERGLALKAAKAVVTGADGEGVIDNVVVLVHDGRIQALGPARTTKVPEGWEVVDCGKNWLMPGLIELHNHTASGNALMVNDLNDSVYLANPGLRASAGVTPDNLLLRRGVAAGVTTVLFIPGSGSNMGGQGVLLKIGHDEYEDMELRNPGSLKLAQAGNPEGFTVGVARSFMNWNTRNTFLRGKAYHEAWKAYEEGTGPKPEKDIQFEVFRDLFSKKTQVSTHTQIFQVVLMTVTMVRMELGLDVYIDHGSFDGYKTAKLAAEQGVPAILGPREVARTLVGRFAGIDTDGKMVGMAAAYQEAGHTMIGFNTDCIDDGGIQLTPPQEELPLQAGMGVRYGMDNSRMAGLRGLTFVPAKAAGIDDRVGSLAVGKDADIVVISGDPLDPRNSVRFVLQDGERVYDATEEGRLW
jgi:imidazolonepropionase-like amidohydrolase